MKSCENCRHFTRCSARSRGVVCNCWGKSTGRKDGIKTMAEEKVLVFKYAEPLGYKKAQDKILKYLNLGE